MNTLIILNLLFVYLRQISTKKSNTDVWITTDSSRIPSLFHNFLDFLYPLPQYFANGSILILILPRSFLPILNLFLLLKTKPFLLISRMRLLFNKLILTQFLKLPIKKRIIQFILLTVLL